MTGSFHMMSGASGSFSSPYYPERYSSLMSDRCSWQITAPEKHRIQLTFSFFQNVITSDKSQGYVEIRDGTTFFSRLLGIFYGSNIMPVVNSTNKHMWIQYVPRHENWDIWPKFRAVYNAFISPNG